ncbi:hypothetical protein PR001_g10047 [Phytophthora rubi]|uniref:Secreted protein n=1 Tax=Phytophthora rubi TaxID=129364 RepID=A0A6A3MLJ1_9STRA|nr:hypothetical protein PR001_g10047 [Phytophthora rubi]
MPAAWSPTLLTVCFMTHESWALVRSLVLHAPARAANSVHLRRRRGARRGAGTRKRCICGPPLCPLLWPLKTR